MAPKLGRCQCARVSALPACMREATGGDGLCDECRSDRACVANRAAIAEYSRSLLAARVEDRVREWEEMRRGGG